MPRIAKDYTNTIFYSIGCRDPEIKDIYIGHTTNFVKRKNFHKRNCINDKLAGHHYYVYQFIRENGGWNNWDMIMIETRNCETHLEACKREREWFDILQPSLNKWRPYVTADEKSSRQIENWKKWKENNKDYFRQYHSNKKQNDEIN
jgi:hypothetical protein